MELGSAGAAFGCLRSRFRPLTDHALFSDEPPYTRSLPSRCPGHLEVRYSSDTRCEYCKQVRLLPV